jgi:patatin-like phospholipase/acyl hydrolase
MKNILSIDGGGIRSYIPLRMLNYIENKTQIPISELFDYFSGVSAGALIVTMILIKNEEGKQKYSTNEILNLFEVQCKKIFESTYSTRLQKGFGLFGSKYEHNNITENFKNTYGDLKISDLLKPLSISTYDLISGKPYYFNLERNSDNKLQDVLRATTAAPTYFEPHEMKINDITYLFVDGGIVTYSPIKSCFLDANIFYNKTNEKNNFYTVSLGAGYFDLKHNPNDKTNSGFIYWYKKILEIYLSGSSDEFEHELYIIGDLIKGNIAKRFDININKYIQIDDTTAFPILKNIMDTWLQENQEQMDKLCADLLVNYINNKISNHVE